MEERGGGFQSDGITMFHHIPKDADEAKGGLPMSKRTFYFLEACRRLLGKLYQPV
jgi:hypothetical protein